MSLRHLTRQIAITREAEARLPEPGLEAAAAQPALAAELAPPEPRMTARDEAIYLLHAAAEVEHALMAQYLYAGYSLDPDGADVPDARRLDARHWKESLLAIAKEEMGHLITVQNLLLLIGGPLHFGREDYPFTATGVYPFELRLEAVTELSLAKYVLAEMPAESDLSPEQQTAVQEIQDRLAAGLINTANHVNRVGQLYNRLIDLFSPHGLPEDASNHLQDSDFLAGVDQFQALEADWAVNTISTPIPGAGGPLAVLVPPVTTRDQAVSTLQDIAQQGEGLQAGGQEANAHFDRFLSVYLAVRDRGGWRATHRLPGDTRAESVPNEDSRRWAHLFNLRYRLLLSLLHHSFLEPGATSDANGQRTPRGHLVAWAFFEMRNIRKLAGLLPTLPYGDPSADIVCAPPFEMPYTLELPTQDLQRWRAHQEIVTECDLLIADIEAATPAPPQEQADVLTILKRTNDEQRAVLADFSGGAPAPAPQGYQRVVEIFEEAVRGFEVPSFHHKFWREAGQTAGRVLTETEFLAQPFVAGAVVPGDHAASELVRVLRRPTRSMPLGRPPIPESEIKVVEDWIDAMQPGGGGGGGPVTGPVAPQIHLDYWRDFDNWAMFQATPQTGAAVNVFFAQAPRWGQFALDPTREPEWNNAVNRADMQSAAALLSAQQAQTVRAHYGDPIDLPTLLDGYQRFGDDSLPDDAARPQDVRHRMNGTTMWFYWSAFADAALRLGADSAFWQIELRAILTGLLNDGLMRGRFPVNGFTADAAGQAAIQSFVTNLAAGQLQAEARRRFVDSGLSM